VEVLVPREELSTETTTIGIAKPAAPEEAKPTESTTDEKQPPAKNAAVEPVEQAPAGPTADAADELPPKRSRRRRQQNSPQARRATMVLRRLYPASRYGDGWPTREEVSDVDLVAHATAEYEKVERQGPKSRWDAPSADTYLRVVGRRV